MVGWQTVPYEMSNCDTTQMSTLFIKVNSFIKKGVTRLDISHSATGHHTLKVSGALYMELYRSAQ